MIPLLKIYDDVTSNKYVSLGITVACTAFMGYVGFKNINMIPYAPITFIVSSCAGVAFALLANTYLVHNERVKTEGERSGIHANLSLLMSIFQSSTNGVDPTFVSPAAT